jgi:hypothetical protein
LKRREAALSSRIRWRFYGTCQDEIESTEEFEMRDDDVTCWVDWDEDEHIVPGTVRVRSVGLAIEEEQEVRNEVLRRFSHDVLGHSSDSPTASNSEDENEPALRQEFGENSAGKLFQETISGLFRMKRRWYGQVAPRRRNRSGSRNR